MTKIEFDTEKVKEIVNKLIVKQSEKINNIIDIAKFIWNVVDDFVDTLTDKNLSLQQKEDIAVGIANCVVFELESKEFITKELADKTRKIIESTDVFLDILLSIYKVVIAKQVTKSIFSFFGFSCCDSVKVEIPKSQKVEVMESKDSQEAQESQEPLEVKEDASLTPIEVKLEIIEEKKEEIPPLESTA